MTSGLPGRLAQRSRVELRLPRHAVLCRRDAAVAAVPGGLLVFRVSPLQLRNLRILLLHKPCQARHLRIQPNVFDKPSGEELALIPRRENGTMKSNVFDKPNPD